ncbi:MAG: hypothetical protein LBK07_05190, partial [Tannerella sp.]|nr:hypothetical protein [Tannerella sp.]
MKRKVYITALCVALAAGAAGQDCTGVNAPLRPSAPRAGRTAASREWGYRDIYPKKTIDRPGDRQRSGEAAYYPYVVSAPSLPVRSAPAYDAPALATLPEGEVIHLAAAPYPWKSMRITYFDAEAWTYRTAVGYV